MRTTRQGWVRKKEDVARETRQGRRQGGQDKVWGKMDKMRLGKSDNA